MQALQLHTMHLPGRYRIRVAVITTELHVKTLAPDRNDLVITKQQSTSESTTVNDHVKCCKVSQRSDILLAQLPASLQTACHGVNMTDMQD